LPRSSTEACFLSFESPSPAVRLSVDDWDLFSLPRSPVFSSVALTRFVFSSSCLPRPTYDGPGSCVGFSTTPSFLLTDPSFGPINRLLPPPLPFRTISQFRLGIFPAFFLFHLTPPPLGVELFSEFVPSFPSFPLEYISYPILTMDEDTDKIKRRRSEVNHFSSILDFFLFLCLSTSERHSPLSPRSRFHRARYRKRLFHALHFPFYVSSFLNDFSSRCSLTRFLYDLYKSPPFARRPFRFPLLPQRILLFGFLPQIDPGDRVLSYLLCHLFPPLDRSSFFSPSRVSNSSHYPLVFFFVPSADFDMNCFQ